ncbi:hypothetical protein GCM10027511_18660 [Hymenobacter humi]
MQPTPEGLLIKPVGKPRRQGWDGRFQRALAQGPVPKGVLLAGFAGDAFEDREWRS